MAIFGTPGAGQLPNTEDDYLGHVTVNYTGAGGKPDFPPRVAYTETAEFNKASLKAFEGIMSPDEREKELENAGWQSVPVPLQDNGGFNVWVGRQGYTDFAGAEGFYRPLAQRQTLMTGKNLIGWDTHFCAVIREQSATGSVAYAQYDYRFNVANRVTDANDNISTSTFDALGRVTSVRFCGLEAGVMQGYTQPENEVTPFIVPALIHDALELKPVIPVAGLTVYAPLSWMPRVTPETTEFKNVSPEDNRMGRLALRRYLRRNSAASFSSNSCLPPHTLNISTDRYDRDPEQQLRQSLSFSDGFGRTLQTAARHEAGQAWQLSDDGTIIADEAGLPINEHTDFRWVVSGRTEYDGKGQPVRTYLPYFLNNWRYVKDDSARRDLFADTSCYDPLGRVWQVVTAAGYLRRTLMTPWFVVSEDENDTAAEVSQ